MSGPAPWVWLDLSARDARERVQGQHQRVAPDDLEHLAGLGPMGDRGDVVEAGVGLDGRRRHVDATQQQHPDRGRDRG